MLCDVKDSAIQYLTFGPLRAPVRFEGCEDLIVAMRSLFLGWDISVSGTRGDYTPVIRYRRKNGRFIWHSRHYPSPENWEKRGRYLKVKDTAADFHYVLFDWYVSEYPHHFCLHCAAVEMAGRLIIFPNIKRAGKSTLVVEMARRGYRVFCDDVLIIDPERRLGLGLGIMPRLRRPFPNSLTEDQRRFVEDHVGLSGSTSSYINLTEPLLATYGAAAPIGAVVLLDRQDTPVKASITRTGEAEALAQLIFQNAPENLSPTLIFDTLSEIAGAADRCRLHYSSLSDAADLLEHAFG